MDNPESRNELFGALAQAQLEFLPLKKNAENPYFGNKYADLAAIRESTTPALSKHGLAIMQLVIADEQFAIVETYLGHKSGQSISSTVKLKPTKADPQGFGSAITYARRYGLGAMLGLASEEDDDGNEASKSTKSTSQPVPAFPKLAALKRELDIGIKAGYQTAIEGWLNQEQLDLAVVTEAEAEKALQRLISVRGTFKKDAKHG